MASETRRTAPLRHWSAWFPLAIPLFFVVLVARRIAIDGGVVVERDEGTEAHLFQLLMPVSVLVSLYYAASWIPRSRAAALVFLVQLASAAAIFGLVYWLEHS